MSECPVEEELSGLIDGELPPERAAAVQAHLERCPRCAAEAASLREVASLNESLAAPAVSSQEWAAAWSAIAERTVRRAAEQPARRTRLRRGLRWALAAAAAAIIGVGVGIVARSGPGGHDSPGPQAVAPSTTDPPEDQSVAEAKPREPTVAPQGRDIEYVSILTYHEEADLTVITVLPLEPEEPTSNGDT